jgi:hypothetical protein
MRSRLGTRSARRRGLVAALLAAIAAPLAASAATLSLTSQHLTTTATCALVSYPKTTTYSTDSFVNQASAAQNNGTATSVTLQSKASQNQRIYVRFDLTSCLFAPPSGAIVRTATLRMLETGALPNVCRTYDVFRNTTAWGETTITWTNQPAGTTANVPASAGRTSSQDLGSPTTCANHAATTYVNWDVTADVSAFLGGTATNDGWMIRDDVEDAAPAVKVNFFARDQNTLIDAPQLLITYSLV